MRRAIGLAVILSARAAAADSPESTPPPPPVPEAPIDDSSLVDPGAPKNVPGPAKPPQPPPPTHAKSDEPTARDAEDAPLPGEESGRTDHPPGDSLLRDIGQGVLTVPRLALVAAIAPLRYGVYAYDHYGIAEKFSTTFFDPSTTYGVYPVLMLDSEYGLNIGARMVHRDMFGAHERFSLKATTGGQFRSLIDGGIRSGNRFGDHVTLELRGEYERRPNEKFYGIGNEGMDRDARYREEIKRVTSYLDIRLFDRFLARATGALTDRMYGSGADGGTPIDAMYDTSMLTGFSGVENLYSELELRVDHRDRDITPGRHKIYDTGYFFEAFAGRVHQLQAGNDYWRYGGEAQHFLGLGLGPRTLMTRVRLEAVTGTLDDVVFAQLPMLGGPQVLRGYPTGRFRDRASAVGTAEYFWGLGELFMASLFVDAGRVYTSFDELTTDDLHIGYGASLQLHSGREYVAGVSIASSIDGGVFLNLTFDPVFDYDPRAERR
jgi:hypothetical protein